MIFQLLWILVLVHIAFTWVQAVRAGRRAKNLKSGTLANPSGYLPPVSIVVPAWNECGTLERCIRALQKVDYPDFEIVIMAGGNDGTFAAALQAAAQDGRFRVFERGPEPKNSALTRGIQASRNEILVLLDADNIVESGWLKALVAPLAAGANVSVGDSAPNRVTWVTQEERMWHILTYQILKLSWIQGDRSIAIRRTVLEKVGGLPRHTYAREDWDLGVRLNQAGEKVVFALGARLVTDRPATLAESWKHQVRWRRTHLAGSWEHRRALFHSPALAFSQLYGYGLSAVLSLGGIAAFFLYAGLPAWRLWILQIILLAAAWLIGRRAALGAEIAAFSGEQAWLWRAWMPVATLPLEILASDIALLSFGRLTPFYKGPRYASS